jgi:hypothetical protein
MSILICSPAIGHLPGVGETPGLSKWPQADEQQRSAASVLGQSQSCFSDRVLKRPCGRRIFPKDALQNKRNQVRSILNSNQFTIIRRSFCTATLEHWRRNCCLNPPCGSFIQSRVHPLCVSAASTRSEEPDGCLRVFFAKLRNMIPTF